MNVVIGRTISRGDLSRAVKKPFQLLELTARVGALPKAARLRQLSSDAPEGFVFSVVVDPACFGEGELQQRAIDYAAGVAAALDARFLVLRSPSSFRPGPVNEKKLLELVERLRKHPFDIAWEPSGLWQPSQTRGVAERAGILRVQRLEQFEPEPRVYLRLVQIGVGRSRLNSQLDELAASLAACEQGYVVVEGPGEGRLCRELLGYLAELEDAPMDDAPDQDADQEELENDSELEAEQSDDVEEDDEDDEGKGL